ncbi:MAG: DMT family transporter [Proteobacteria bacterium]|nr:DMT family transporter [Pseudomonadota bacterium]
MCLSINCIYYNGTQFPEVASEVSSFVRVFINLIFVIVSAFFIRDSSGKNFGLHGLFGDFRPSLWLRGIFGTLSVLTFFFGIKHLGVGEASFLNSSNSIWIALLSPLLLGQKSTMLSWCAVLFGLFGLYLLYQPNFNDAELTARTVALSSGFFGACAYMMISRAGRSNHPFSMVFYFTFVASIVHVVWFAFSRPRFPTSGLFWMILILAGLVASVAQILMTMAYQKAPAALVSAISFLTPTLSMVLGVVLFRESIGGRAIIGMIVVLFSGLFIPFISVRKNAV